MDSASRRRCQSILLRRDSYREDAMGSSRGHHHAAAEGGQEGGEETGLHENGQGLPQEKLQECVLHISCF